MTTIFDFIRTVNTKQQRGFVNHFAVGDHETTDGTLKMRSLKVVHTSYSLREDSVNINGSMPAEVSDIFASDILASQLAQQANTNVEREFVTSITKIGSGKYEVSLSIFRKIYHLITRTSPKVRLSYYTGPAVKKLIATVSRETNRMASVTRHNRFFLVTNPKLANHFADSLGFKFAPFDGPQSTTSLHYMGDIGNIAVFIDIHQDFNDDRIHICSKCNDTAGFFYVHNRGDVHKAAPEQISKSVGGYKYEFMDQLLEINTKDTIVTIPFHSPARRPLIARIKDYFTKSFTTKLRVRPATA